LRRRSPRHLALIIATGPTYTFATPVFGGQVKEGFGRVTGDERMQLEGRARQAEGTLQDVYGQAKETAAGAAGAIRDKTSEATDFLREMIEERPFTAASTALGIGFLIGRYGQRSD
jgi:uncharacterized protein YjbJ (UPF0337 family)